MLFGKSFDEKLYNSTIEGCMLLQEINMLPNGHETLIGEKGITLSGGQKQRISLARAIYSGADIFLLDDPLSSVDNEVADLIFNNIFSKSGILGEKTRILVTSNVNYLQYVDEIVVLKGGEIIDCGPWVAINESVEQHLQDHVEKANKSKLEASKAELQTPIVNGGVMKKEHIERGQVL